MNLIMIFFSLLIASISLLLYLKYKDIKTNPFKIKDKYISSTREFKIALDKSIDAMDYKISLSLSILEINNLDSLSRKHAESLRNLLKHYPKNVRKCTEFKGLKPLEVIELNKILKKPTLSPRTIKSIIQCMSTFCTWCVSHGYIKTNHFYKLPTLKPRAKDVRFDFNDEQLTSIFHMDDYTRFKFKHSYYYWIPLLLRLTGARLNELCQLWRKDIKLIDNIWCLVIHENHDGQRVKNMHSARIIPIHSALLERGFIEFVKSKNTNLLFDELKATDGYYSHNVSKWFARRRASLGLGKGLDAHSFRHTFSSELKRKEVSKAIVEELLGHSHNSISFDLYGKKFPPHKLLEVVELIDDSHLAHIKPFYN
ncbi:site-specific integrase [Photobacterium leiognathi]|uniref:site-specific integrase n=1 Tax=Photobacterium leiognathi TaxID=553611 RepID=UPI002982AC14|nr:site-specific integrase [Photobacterium leiognathi]